MNPKNEIYGLSNLDHKLILKYKPQFLAVGGEHVVYNIPEHPNIVLKVSILSVKINIDWNANHGRPIDFLSSEIETRYQEYLKNQNERYLQMKKYFGSNHVLGQKKFMIRVPITENILNTLYDGNPPIIGNEVWGIVTVQKKAEGISDPSRHTLIAGYSEREDIQPEVYNEVTDNLVLGRNLGQRISKEQLIEVHPNPPLKFLLDGAENDENLKESLKDFVEKCIWYTEETDEILDLAGSDNVIFTKKDNKWTYRLVDALYPLGKSVKKAKSALLKISVGNELTKEDKIYLLNTVNYVRLINGLADLLGIHKRINIVPEVMVGDKIDLLEILRTN